MKYPFNISNKIKWFSFFLLLSIACANVVLIVPAVCFLILIILGFIIKLPHDITVERYCSNSRVYAGQIIEVKIKFCINKGFGVVLLSDSILDIFELVEGYNYAILWKVRIKITGVISYKVRCYLPGKYVLKSIKWESKHAIYTNSTIGENNAETCLELLPKILEPKRLRLAMRGGMPLPTGSILKKGAATLDFKELREYNYGDSFRNINWKATARNITHSNIWPVVNEYEKEGRNIVWIFLEESNYMKIGVGARNVFAHSYEIIASISSYYIAKGCQLAFSTY